MGPLRRARNGPQYFTVSRGSRAEFWEGGDHSNQNFHGVPYSKGPGPRHYLGGGLPDTLIGRADALPVMDADGPTRHPRGKRARQRTTARRRNRILGVLAITVAVIGAAGVLSLQPTAPNAVNTSLHQHPNLQVFIAGQAQVVPGDIGIAANHWVDHSMDAYGEMAGMSPLHTHDSSGVIHLEMSRWHACTLGDLFAVWGQPFDEGHLLSSAGAVSMTVNGNPSTEFRGLVLQDGQQIVVRAG